MIKKFLKRAATLGLALSLVVTQLTPLVPLTPKVVKAATLKYHCNTCGQDLTSKGSHTRQTTCGGTSFERHAIYCGGSVTVTDTEQIKKDHGGVYSYLDKYYLHCNRCGRDWARIEERPDTCDAIKGYYFTCNSCGTKYDSPTSCTHSDVKTCSGTVDNGAITPLQATLTFNSAANDGSSSNFTRNPDYDSVYSYTTSDTASKDGWDFVGWNENSNAKNRQESVTMDDNKTVYAIFKKDLPVKFTDVNGTEKRVTTGSAVMYNKDTSAAVKLPEQGTKTDWTPMGWSLSKNPDLSDIISDATYDISESTDFYGVYKKRKVINIDTDGDGTPNDTVETDIISNGSEPDKTEGKVTAPATPAAIEEGHHFTGWKEKGGSTVYQPGEEMIVTGNRDIVPVNEPNSYKVHFESNGAEGSMPDQEFTYGEAKTLTPNSFTKTGHVFVGWLKTQGGSEKYDDGQQVSNLTTENNGTVNLYAVWRKSISGLTVNPAGGTWKHDGNSYTAPEPFEQDYNTTLSIEEPERTGYTFNGWNLTSATTAGAINGQISTGGGITYTFGEKDGAADILTANWEINGSTVKVNPNGGTWTHGGNIHTDEQIFTQNYRTKLTVETPSREGYDFDGWKQTGSNGSLAGDTYTFGPTAGGEDTLTAQWSAHHYKIHFNGNGKDSGDMEDQEFTYDEDRKLTKNSFKRTGYTFKGWSTTVAGNKVYNDEQSVKNLATENNGTVTLYAVWEINHSGLTVVPNGGKWQHGEEASDENKTFSGAFNDPVTIADPFRVGYDFNGWKKSKRF